MNKNIIIASLISASILFNGCGGSDDNVYVSPVVPSPSLVTLFLIDQNGFSLAGVPYKCESMEFPEYTPNNGEFSFYAGENCSFDFLDFNGNYNNDPYAGDDIIYIVSDLNTGAGDIAFDCNSFGSGITYPDGSFDYNRNDSCSFYF